MRTSWGFPGEMAMPNRLVQLTLEHDPCAHVVKRRAAMPKLINCECGHVVRGENDDELIRNAEEHMNSDHPALVGKISRDDLLAMAEEAEA